MERHWLCIVVQLLLLRELCFCVSPVGRQWLAYVDVVCHNIWHRILQLLRNFRHEVRLSCPTLNSRPPSYPLSVDLLSDFRSGGIQRASNTRLYYTRSWICHLQRNRFDTVRIAGRAYATGHRKTSKRNEKCKSRCERFALQHHETHWWEIKFQKGNVICH